jgi:hypothetical protein
MALTRLATRGDLSQLRWARWQSARSFDAHSLSAYGLRPAVLAAGDPKDPSGVLYLIVGNAIPCRRRLTHKNGHARNRTL